MKLKRQGEVFHFKKFSVQHDRSAMKVGTDAVLLGAWVNIENAKRILDIGTGSGVIALMLAQRTDGHSLIEAIDMEKVDAEQARENVLRSPWPKKVVVYQSRLQEFETDEKYDLIVSNPPYFVNSLQPPSKERTKARHANELTFDELITHSLRLLNSQGKISVILPVVEGEAFKSIAIKNGLRLIRETAFYSREEKQQERWLFEFSTEPQKMISDKLILYDAVGEKSAAYRGLTGEFYL